MKLQDPAQLNCNSLFRLQLLATEPRRWPRRARSRTSHVAAEAWRLLSEINANSQRWDEALSDLEIALQHQPDSRPLRLRRALLPEQSGDSQARSLNWKLSVRQPILQSC